MDPGWSKFLSEGGGSVSSTSASSIYIPNYAKSRSDRASNSSPKKPGDSLISTLPSTDLRWIKQRRRQDVFYRVAISFSRERQLEHIFSMLDFNNTGHVDTDILKEAASYVEEKLEKSKATQGTFHNLRKSVEQVIDNSESPYFDFNAFVNVFAGSAKSVLEKASERDCEFLHHRFVEFAEQKVRENALNTLVANTSHNVATGSGNNYTGTTQKASIVAAKKKKLGGASYRPQGHAQRTHMMRNTSTTSIYEGEGSLSSSSGSPGIGGRGRLGSPVGTRPTTSQSNRATTPAGSNKKRPQTDGTWTKSDLPQYRSFQILFSNASVLLENRNSKSSHGGASSSRSGGGGGGGSSSRRQSVVGRSISSSNVSASSSIAAAVSTATAARGGSLHHQHDADASDYDDGGTSRTSGTSGGVLKSSRKKTATQDNDDAASVAVSDDREGQHGYNSHSVVAGESALSLAGAADNHNKNTTGRTDTTDNTFNITMTTATDNAHGNVGDDNNDNASSAAVVLEQLNDHHQSGSTGGGGSYDKTGHRPRAGDDASYNQSQQTATLTTQKNKLEPIGKNSSPSSRATVRINAPPVTAAHTAAHTNKKGSKETRHDLMKTSSASTAAVNKTTLDHDNHTRSSLEKMVSDFIGVDICAPTKRDHKAATRRSFDGSLNEYLEGQEEEEYAEIERKIWAERREQKKNMDLDAEERSRYDRVNDERHYVAERTQRRQQTSSAVNQTFGVTKSNLASTFVPSCRGSVRFQMEVKRSVNQELRQQRLDMGDYDKKFQQQAAGSGDSRSPSRSIGGRSVYEVAYGSQSIITGGSSLESIGSKNGSNLTTSITPVKSFLTPVKPTSSQYQSSSAGGMGSTSAHKGAGGILSVVTSTTPSSPAVALQIKIGGRNSYSASQGIGGSSSNHKLLSSPSSLHGTGRPLASATPTTNIHHHHHHHIHTSPSPVTPNDGGSKPLYSTNSYYTNSNINSASGGGRLSPFASSSQPPAPKPETLYLHMNGTVTDRAVDPPIVRDRSAPLSPNRWLAAVAAADHRPRPTGLRIVPLSQAISAARHQEEVLDKDFFIYNSDLPRKTHRYSFEMTVTGQVTSGAHHSPISNTLPHNSNNNSNSSPQNRLLFTAISTAAATASSDGALLPPPITGRSFTLAAHTGDDDQPMITTGRALTAVTPRSSGRVK